MKEITESNQIYVVSDNYPKKPYVKYIKERGTPPVVTTLEDKVDALRSELASLKKAMEDSGAIAKQVGA